MFWNDPELYDPVGDMKAAIEKLSKSDPHYWERRAKIEEQVEEALKRLTELNYNPKEIELILIKHGIWPEVF